MRGSRRPRWVPIATEGVALLVVLALVSAKLAEVSAGSWRAVFLANGDSLVLPLVLQSLQRGEPFHWVFSSQTFFFPEFPLYAICGLIMGTPQGGLVLNAILNVVLLYAGFRGVAAAFAPSQRVRQVLVSSAAIILFLVATLTEAGVRVVGAGTVEPSRIATVYLMTTYYGGAILVSLGMLALVIWVSDRFRGGPARRGRVVAFGAIAIVAGGAVTYSDPLFLLWFVAPLGLALVILLLVRRITLRWVLIVIFPQIVGLGAGMLARALFARFIAANIDHYLATFGIPQAAGLLAGVVAGWVRSPAGILQLLILLAPIALVVVVLVRSVRHRTLGDPARLDTVEVFLALFIVISVSTLIVGQIVTGQSVTRYLLPLFVFPPLGLLLVRPDAVRDRLRALPSRAGTGAVAIASAAALVTIGVSAPAVADLASPRSPVDTACLDDWLAAQPDGGRDVDGVGSFWVVRALALYGHQDGELLQIALPLAAHAWMNNLALYDDASPSYVLADDVIDGSELRSTLGAPTSITPCRGFDIYDYAGTPGEAKLDAAIRTSLQVIGIDHRY